MKNCYKKAHAKARIKAQAAKGSNKFGAANTAEQYLGVGFKNSSGVTAKNGGKSVGLKALKGYFDNLVATATNKKTVFEQLVASNAKLAATNE